MAYLMRIVFAVAVAAALQGCEAGVDYTSSPEHGDASSLLKGIAILDAAEGHRVSGQITFTQVGEGVLVDAEVAGLSSGLHGFHIHESGDVTAPDGSAAGGHFNPVAAEHGGPLASTRHVGDLGNLVADGDGRATYSRMDTVIELEGAHSIVGRAVVVHAGEDDLISQPSGNAGERVAVGVIGVAKAY